MSRGTVLVTGGTGSVGIDIVRHLAHDGWLVQCMLHLDPVRDWIHADDLGCVASRHDIQMK